MADPHNGDEDAKPASGSREDLTSETSPIYANDPAIAAIKNLGLVLISGYGGYQYAARKFSKEKD